MFELKEVSFIELINIKPNMEKLYGIKTGDIFKVLRIKNTYADFILPNGKIATATPNCYLPVEGTPINYIKGDGR